MFWRRASGEPTSSSTHPNPPLQHPQSANHINEPDILADGGDNVVHDRSGNPCALSGGGCDDDFSVAPTVEEKPAFDVLPGEAILNAGGGDAPFALVDRIDEPQVERLMGEEVAKLLETVSGRPPTPQPARMRFPRSTAIARVGMGAVMPGLPQFAKPHTNDQTRRGTTSRRDSGIVRRVPGLPICNSTHQYGHARLLCESGQLGVDHVRYQKVDLVPFWRTGCRHVTPRPVR